MKRLTMRRNSDGSVSQPTYLDWCAVLDKLTDYEDAEEQGRLVEVIRCKDCVYLGFKDFRGICKGAVCHPITPEYFCSFAKRRVE